VQLLKNYALQYLHINDSITKVRQRAKISMLKLDTILKKKERKTYNLKYKIEQDAQQKKNNCTYLIVGTITAIGIVITYLLWPKNKREK
jgi:hypothetical protein